jgi:tRNA (guanine37-N1)-methyltransferase
MWAAYPPELLDKRDRAALDGAGFPLPGADVAK